jgi:hypothetical protein
VVVKHLPRSSALVREIEGEAQVWGLTEQLLAAAVDALNGANWQRGNGKKADKPKQIPRPGVEQEKKYGGEAVSMEEMAERLERRRHLAVVADQN